MISDGLPKASPTTAVLKLARSLALLLALFAGVGARGEVGKIEDYLTPPEFEFVRDVGLELRRQGGFVLSIGRSPNVFYGFLKALNPNMTATVPVSEFHYAPTEAAVASGLYNRPLTEAQRTILFRMFDEFIPPRDVLGDRPIHLMDLSNSMLTLHGVRAYLQQYLRENGRTNEIRTLALVNYSPEGQAARAARLGIDHFSAVKLPDSLDRKMQNNLLAKYGPFTRNPVQFFEFYSKAQENTGSLIPDMLAFIRRDPKSREYLHAAWPEPAGTGCDPRWVTVGKSLP